MGLTMRPSNPTLRAVGRALAGSRETIVIQWANWIAGRMAAAPHVERPTLERQLRLLVDIMIEMAGPLRRNAVELWVSACESYGRTAAERGLAAGEVVEEIQHLRELLIRQLSELIAALPARYSMATVLRLNRLLDKGIAHAVVGYTDALVETLFNQNGVPVSANGKKAAEHERRIEVYEAELAKLRVTAG